MKTVRIFGVLLAVFMLWVSFGAADETSDLETASEYVWNGTWVSPSYTMYITQDESAISGAYVPFDLFEFDTGYLEGNISPDGRTYSGIWIETGKNTNTLSSDLMSFSISGYTDTHGLMAEPVHYTSNATRVGDIVDTAYPWTGNYVSEWKTYNFTQDGDVVYGTNEPLPGVDDNPGVIEGTVSEDGMTFNGTWIEKGNYTMVIDDEGMTIHATIYKSLEPDAIKQDMTFSK